MKSTVFSLTLLAFVASAPCVFAQAKAPAAPKEAPTAAVKEADYAKALLGSWRQDIKQGPVSGVGITTYLEGGKATSVGNFDAGGQKIEVKAKAKWSLVKNKLTIEITESSLPEMMPVGTKMVETILSLTDKEFKYLDETSGEEVTEKRVVLDKDGKIKPEAE
jgi:hypothetical protein